MRHLVLFSFITSLLFLTACGGGSSGDSSTPDSSSTSSDLFAVFSGSNIPAEQCNIAKNLDIINGTYDAPFAPVTLDYSIAVWNRAGLLESVEIDYYQNDQLVATMDMLPGSERKLYGSSLKYRTTSNQTSACGGIVTTKKVLVGAPENDTTSRESSTLFACHSNIQLTCADSVKAVLRATDAEGNVTTDELAFGRSSERPNPASIIVDGVTQTSVVYNSIRVSTYGSGYTIGPGFQDPNGYTQSEIGPYITMHNMPLNSGTYTVNDSADFTQGDKVVYVWIYDATEDAHSGENLNGTVNVLNEGGKAVITVSGTTDRGKSISTVITIPR